MTEAVSQTLLWVNQELTRTLQEARQALENYIERPENTGLLKTCADLMHEAAGALNMVEVQGGSLLAEEVEQVARRMLAAPADPNTRGEALEALSRAMVQLPTYMERVVNGGRDIPLILLPLLNDLRAVRGQALLSENTLLLLNLPADRRLDLQRPAGSEPSGVDIQGLARQVRPRLQAALLGWIRGDRPDSSLAVMADVVGALEDASHSDRSYQLWWVTAGVIEALRQGGLDGNAAIKRMLGQVDLQVRRLAEDGEIGLEASPPIALLNSLLFYIARSSTRGRRVGAIRQCFSLGDLIPASEELESARDSLSAPSVRLMQTVGGAIKDDLARVKDVLDIFVRTGMKQVDELEPQADLLKKIGDTLGVLGLASLQDVVRDQSARLRAFVDGASEPDEEALLETAAHLIEVEDNIERQLIGMITEEQDVADGGQDVEVLEARKDFNDVTASVLKECNVNLGRVKEAIVQSLEEQLDPKALHEVPQLLRAITAGLLMLDRTRAVSLVEQVGAQIRDWLSLGDAPPSDDAMDHLADAIVSLEYFMETIASGRSDPMYMLDDAEASLRALNELARRPAVTIAAIPDETGEVAATLVIAPPFPAETGAGQATEEASGTAAAEDDVVAAESAPRVGPVAGAIDPELLELFIEEAGELAASMRERFPEWEGTPENEAAIGELRRLFHTLKGSGRMVGAELIGDFAWSVEDLLNRLMSGTVELTEPMTAFVGEAIGHVPGLIDQLETGSTPAFDVAAFVARAEALVAGRSEPSIAATGAAPDAAPEAEEVEAAPEHKAAAAAPSARGGEEMDPVLRDIFAKEAGEHLATIREFLKDSGERAAPFAVTEELYRACHTLAGSANMAAVAPAVAVAAPLDRLVRRLHGDNVGMSADLLALCAAAADIFTRIIDIVRDGGDPELAVDDVAAALQREHEEYALRADAAADEEPAPAEPEPAPAAAMLELDPEIAAIFQEEADEILERCDEVLEIWRSDLTAQAPLDELKRQLHTLKGGARLAGLVDMGDFSHSLEDLATDLGIEPAAVSKGVELVQRCLDELHRMREGIDLGQAIAPSPELLRELQGEEPSVSVESAPADSPSLEIGEEVAEVLDFDLSGAAGEEPEPVELVPDVPERAPVDVPPGGTTDEAFPAVLDAPVEEIAAPAESPGEAPAEWIAAFGGPDWAPVPRRAWTFGPPPASSPQLRATDWPRPEVERPDATAEQLAAAASLEVAPPDELDRVVEPADAQDAVALETTDAGLLEAPAEPSEQPVDEAFERPAAESGEASVTDFEEIHAESTDEAPAAAEEDTQPRDADEALDVAAEDTQPAEADEALAAAAEDTQPAEADEAFDATAEDIQAGEADEALDAAAEDTQPGDADEALVAESDDAGEQRAEDAPAAAAGDASPEATDKELAAEADDSRTGEADESAPEAAAPPKRPAPPIELPTAAAPGFVPAANEIRASTPAITARAEIARVDADLLEGLLNNAGEVSIYRSRLEQQVGSIEFNLDELSQTVIRLREQLRKLEMETDAQASYGRPELTPRREGFDALEMDRYSVIQQLTRAMAETASDVSSLQHLLTDLTRDADTLLTQQSRVITELQDGLMSTRMVPFSRHVQRLNRIVRQAAREAGKQAELYVSGGENELDRQVMERMLGPFEHLLRNAIIHGIETPEERVANDKDAAGRIGIELRRDGAEMSIVVSDDGAGLDIDAIRRKAEAQGFIEPGVAIDAEAAADLIFRPGFSTAIQLTLAAGRGVGMDVVANEIRELGGSLRVESDAGTGLRFIIRLPYTRAITQALIMRAGEELFALPLPTVEGIARVGARDLGRHIGDDAVPFEYGGHAYRVRHLASLVDGQARPLPADDSYVPVVLVRAGEHSTAVIGDEMLGAREIVVKTLGPQFTSVAGVAGATILGDGSIVVILDAASLVRAQPHASEALPVGNEEEARDGRTFVMVVDDSITVRRVTERLLERNGMRVITAKDGIDAVSLLREHRPDIMLLDIEMPRMDGYEVANHVRNDRRLQHIPIVMITSRVGQKHRNRAMESGVNDYLGKPYQENQLLAAIGALVDERRVAGAD